MRTFLVLAAACITAACNSSPQPQPSGEDVVNATHVDSGPPNAALSNGEAMAPADREGSPDVANRQPDDVAADFATFLNQRKFDEAYALWDPASVPKDQFERQFARLKTIQAAIGKIGDVEGAAGSLYDEIQLTLSGETTDGDNYVLTGPLTLRRVNDVPGSTEEQRRWRIVKLQLTGNPKAAKVLING